MRMQISRTKRQERHESRFSTRSDSQRVLIWREIGTRFYPSNTKERHRYGGVGVPVWRGIMLNGQTELHILDRGSVTGDSYCDEVLHPHVLLFRGAIGPNFIFMDANAWPHLTLAVEELLESEDITRMDWTAYSPDFNLIEHLYQFLLDNALTIKKGIVLKRDFSALNLFPRGNAEEKNPSFADSFQGKWTVLDLHKHVPASHKLLSVSCQA
ncbi:transposable element Tcb1 transposase [Trichonephila clavipes]|nr:transposable element Tcb1 transposase [Trichonephila clavipes]